MINLGAYKVFPLTDGAFYLDAGQILGVIPKVMWEKEFTSDEANRIPLYLRPLLVDTGDMRVLVETGIGDRYDEKFARIYSIVRERKQLISSLKDAGYEPSDITHVIYTHLHFDHAGGSTYVDEGGVARLTFPNAEHFIPWEEWEFMQDLNERTKPSYKTDWFDPVVASGRLRRVRNGENFFPGFTYLKTPGHTPSHSSVLIQSEGQHLIYWGDLMPFVAHLKPAWIAGVDTHPLTTLETKKAFLKRAFDEGWHYHYFYHEKKPLYTAEEAKSFLERK